jgi:hypothetical protein
MSVFKTDTEDSLLGSWYFFKKLSKTHNSRLDSSSPKFSGRNSNACYTDVIVTSETLKPGNRRSRPDYV